MMRRQLAAVTAAFADKNGAESVTKIDASEAESSGLIADIVNINMFALRRLIIVHGAEENKSVWTALGENLNRVPGETDLVIVATRADKRTKTFKELMKTAKVREFPMLKGRELTDWTMREAADHKVEIKRDAIDELIAATGGDQWRIATEIAKFAALDRVVNKKLIHELIEPNLEANAFQLLDHALNRRRAETATELAKLRQLEDPNKFLGLLASQVYALAAVQAAGGKTTAEIARDTGVHPFVSEKVRDLARKLDARGISQLSQRVATADSRMKLGEDGWTLIELVLARI